MDMVQKAVIMARGLGTRMRRKDESAVLDRRQSEVAGSGLKALIPIDRPFLDYVISALADAGYSRVCLVIGPEHQVVRDYYTIESPPRRVRIEFAVQEKPLGTADAVRAAREFAGGDLFLAINSDNYYPVEILAAMRALRQSGVALFDRDALVAESNIPADRVQKFSVAEIDMERCLRHIYEKPDDDIFRRLGSPLYVSMNCWVFSPAIFKACLEIRPSARGELELTDAVQYAIDVLGEKHKAMMFRSAVLDLATRSDVAAVAERLKKITPNP
ncbi:MAG TPA: nucleotidyltransferase family protein [Acidobacteriota bacterium]|nr:nucleotidyltransferase family protein [Acidobacteriota bacterium]